MLKTTGRLRPNTILSKPLAKNKGLFLLSPPAARPRIITTKTTKDTESKEQ
jgi:hypothetical protein